MSATLNYIDFPLPTGIAAAYNADPELACFFVGTNTPGNILRLTFDPKAYTPFPGLQPEAQKGYTTHFATIQDKERGFEINWAESREDFLYLFQDWQNSLYSNGQYSLMTCYDYHVLDTSADRALGYTLRQGWLSYERQSGTVRDTDTATSRRFSLGYKIKFVQIA